MTFISPVTLTGKHATLEPLGMQHLDDLRSAAADGELWKLWYTSVPQPDQTAEYIAKALQQREQGNGFAFAVRDSVSGRVVGSTRYCNVMAENRRLEIGYTWYARQSQRTGINTESKLMLLTHAFEVLDCVAVEFRTNWMNHASREAIARLGAKQDGVLRNHMLMPGGIYRDTVVFSIITSEWPAVRQHLNFKLER